jgi:HPt (histidine-containing phosphotransfer) domain-containing protein
VELKASGYLDIACAWLARQARSRPQVPKEARDDRARPEYGCLTDPVREYHDFNEQELELKTNTDLTREIHRLTTELHRRLIDHRNR